MSPPNECPIEIVEIMTKCWSFPPEDRPSFKNIYDSFIPKQTETSTMGHYIMSPVPNYSISPPLNQYTN